MRIGFFDSGIGGLTVLHQALKLLPQEDYLFYADTSHVPYGEKTKDEVREYILQAVDFMAKQHIKALVVACNTATSIVIEELRQRYDFPVLGIEPAVKPAVEQSEGKQKKVLVLATRLTLQEKKYHDLVHRIDHGEIVDSLPLPGLVEFAEHFDFDEERIIPYLTSELAHLDLKRYSTVVLGCTHFPYFEGSLRKIFPDTVDFISGSHGTARHLMRILQAGARINEGMGDILFYRSGVLVDDPAMLSKYERLFKRLDDIEQSINLSKGSDLT
ncbi:glutamate racemase [Paenibacillus sp. FSL R7-0337]|uniref:glutamate racemase n=1 Tax=Paenibacillus sp. FSL R7-0337 TaxID=1926588 RepID=UPI00096F8315|nr:glutamate racemase [Paenibacillus sp. FSL R7-0337]OMF93509.1 glutamate racemase [Paenibacillus sp. FSL R7-0337]